MTTSSDSFRNVTKYTGQDYRFAPSYIRPRAPTSADIKPKEQQGYYPITSLWTYPASQNIYALASITNNLANWILISSGSSGPTLGFPVPNGTSPVVPSALGQVTLTSSGGTIAITGSTNAINFDVAGGAAVEFIQGDDGVSVTPTGIGIVNLLGLVVANGTHAKAVFTESPLAHTEKIDVQVGAAIAATDVTKVGLLAASNAQFSVDANGFTTLKGGTGPALLTLSDDVGTKASPDATGNIQLVGHVVEAGATKFSTIVQGTNLLNVNPMSSFRWIVDPLGFNGTHTTLTSALASATSGDTINILPGSVLTENVTLKAGVNLYSSGAFTYQAGTGAAVIIGKCTMTTAGSVNISGIELQTNSDFLLAVTGSAASNVNLENCYLNCTNNTGINLTSSGGATINLFNCSGDIGTTGIALFNNASVLIGNNCYFTNSGASTTPSATSGTISSFINSLFNSPFSTSSVGTVAFTNCSIDTSPTNTSCITTVGTGDNTCTRSVLISGTASAISIGAGTRVTADLSKITTTNTNAITGAGTLVYGPLVFGSTGISINTTTQTVLSYGPRIQLSGGCQMVSGSGSPNGSITAPKGSLWLRTDGSGINDRAYINTDAGTTWTAIVTVA